ncbi:hypothetical protein OB919_03005 [Halobacteria archaeon AArc-curdl1]|uniref:DUF6602 domain-containing protein n=1 Tax=Natronosalvus hydrolyticus TaxID=2979988 RepID=A0AAP2Z580_9EURY|nr:hypothetical protein [Halobacteria archaeon AArc-curdl1]
MVNQSEKVEQELLNGLRNRLRSRWKEYRKQSYNPNTKGGAYEQALAKFLRDYVGGSYDIRTRTAVIDDDLKALELFSPAQNEIDVVASFPQSKPQVVFESEGMTWAPYNGVAFICEVKSTLTTTALREDLEKTGKLSEIEREGGLGVSIGGETTVDYQLKCLVYDDYDSVDMNTVYEILDDNSNAWDLVLLVENDQLIAHPDLPFTETVSNPLYYKNKTDSGIVHTPNGLIWFLSYLSVSIDYPPTITTVNPILQMIHRESIRTNFLPDGVSLERLEELAENLSEGESIPIEEVEKTLGTNEEQDE